VPPMMCAASVSLRVAGAGGVHFCARAPKRRWYQQRVGAMSPPERDLLFGRRFLGPGRGSDAGARNPEAGAEVVLLGAECHRLAGEVLDLLQKCGVVGGWTNASERQLRCDLGDVSTQRAAASNLHSC
jgi:hypothetical protein